MQKDSPQIDAAAPAADDEDFDRHFAEAAGSEPAADEPKDDGPAQAGRNAEADADASATDGAATSQDSDPWAGASPELISARDAEIERARRDADHRARSELGRQYAPLTRENRALREQIAKRPPETGAKEIRLSDVLGSAEFKAFEDQYGDDMAPMIQALKAAARETGTIGAVTSTIAERAAAADEAAKMQQLSEAVPGWIELLAGNWDAFTGWLGAQPRHVQEAYFRNEQTVSDPAEAIDVLTRFKASLQPAEKPGTQRDARRSEQLDGAASVNSRNPQAAPAADGDFEAEFALAAKKLERAR